MSDDPSIDPSSDFREKGNIQIIRAKGRRGGQPGNRNALRHGFYAKNLGMSSPSKLNEYEMRNLLGEAAMLKDYMYILYNRNLEICDSTVLAETLRALSLASMALARLLQVHSDIRIVRSNTSVDSSLAHLLADMDTAANHANSLATSLNIPPDGDDDL